MLFNPLELNKFIHVEPDDSAYAVTGGTSDVTSEPIDVSGFESVAAIVTFGDNADTAVLGIKLQQSDATGSGWEDVTGAIVGPLAAGASNSDNKMLGVGFNGITKKYVRSVIDRGTANAVVAHLLFVLGGPRTLPVSQDASSTGQFFSAPVVAYP